MCERLEEHDAVCLAVRWHAEDRRPIVVRGDLVDRHAADDLAVRKVELRRGNRRSSASARGCNSSTRSKAACQATALPSRSHLRTDEQNPLTRVANPAPGSSPFGQPAVFCPARTQATCASGIPYSSTRQRRVASLIVKTMLAFLVALSLEADPPGGNRSLGDKPGKPQALELSMVCVHEVRNAGKMPVEQRLRLQREDVLPPREALCEPALAAGRDSTSSG